MGVTEENRIINTDATDVKQRIRTDQNIITEYREKTEHTDKTDKKGLYDFQVFSPCPPW